MIVMKKGFYTLGPYIYYGAYPKNHVSGKLNLSFAKSENIKTDKKFSSKDVAWHFYDNHALTEQELTDLQQALEIFSDVLNIKKTKDVDFSQIEEKLETVLPEEIKILYTILCQTDCLFSGDDHFLSLEELYIDDQNLVFYKSKRTPTAISVKEGVLMRYYKKKWDYSFGDESFLCFVLDRIAVKAITQMPWNKKGKVRGELKSIMNPEKYLEKVFLGKLNILREYRNYGNILLFNKTGILAWFRQNGFYADILVGCSNEPLLHEIMAVELSISWQI